jgi:hypothetical protein
VDIITALTPALLPDALLGETTRAGDTVCGPTALEAFCLGCGLKAGLKYPSQSMVHVRWVMSISIINQFLSKCVLCGTSSKPKWQRPTTNKPIPAPLDAPHSSYAPLDACA